jgi:hypothetical protein
MDCNTEEESVALVRLLPPTQAALLDWAVNLMADVVQQESTNKMNARNIAMVFAPNMTQVINHFFLLKRSLVLLVPRTHRSSIFLDVYHSPSFACVFLSSQIFEVDSPQIFALKIYLISSSHILLHISESLLIVS